MVIKVGKERYYPVKELVRLLSLTPVTVRSLLRQNKIAGKKIGKCWLVREEDLQKYLNGE